jgi:hypothetical protein
MVKMLKRRLEPKCLVVCVACTLEATKIEKNVIWALWYSIDQEFHVVDENTRESQF